MLHKSAPRLYKYLFPRLTVQSEKSGGVNRKNQHRQSNYSEVNQSAGKTAAEIISTRIYERRLNRGIVFLQKHIALNNLAKENKKVAKADLETIANSITNAKQLIFPMLNAFMKAQKDMNKKIQLRQFGFPQISYVKTRIYIIIYYLFGEQRDNIPNLQLRLTYTYANFQSMRMQIFANANTVGAGKTRWVTAVVYSFETPCDRIWWQTPALSSVRLK